MQALQLFSRYLRETGKSGIGFNLEWLEDSRNKPVWLTVQEVRQLYEATDDSVLGLRDQAMLAVFYGCGLRLNEGSSLEVGDVITDRRLLYVRKGKGYKERYVPIAGGSYEQLRLYIDHGSRQLLQTSSQMLFIGANKGKGLTKQSLYVRIKLLAKKTKLIKNAVAYLDYIKYNGSNEGMPMGFTSTTTETKTFVEWKKEGEVRGAGLSAATRRYSDGLGTMEGGVKTPFKLGPVALTQETKSSTSTTGDRETTVEVATAGTGKATFKAGVTFRE